MGENVKNLKVFSLLIFINNFTNIISLSINVESHKQLELKKLEKQKKELQKKIDELKQSYSK